MQDKALLPRLFKGVIGVAAADITPPEGICISNWGAAGVQVASGIHQPLFLHCITFQSSAEDKPLVLLSADLGWWKNMYDENDVRNYILKTLGIEESRLLFCLTHTHAGPSICSFDTDLPGGDLIPPYLETIKTKAIEVITASLENAQDSCITWNKGRCALAQNRDLYIAKEQRYVVGYNEKETPDDTILIGRITGEKNNTLAVIVNYACHPTTLAWNNTLISPDFVGSMRELINTYANVPILFLQGASGELSPADQYTGDVAVAEKNGKILGFSVLSALQCMGEAGYSRVLSSIVESGAPLAVFSEEKINDTTNAIQSRVIRIRFDLKDQTPIKEIKKQWEEETVAAVKERLWRRVNIRSYLGDQSFTEISVWIWRIGDTFIIGHPNEAYSWLQKELRAHFPNVNIVVINIANGHIGYLPPEAFFDYNVYTVWQTPFARGSLERMTEQLKKEIESMISD